MHIVITFADNSGLLWVVLNSFDSLPFNDNLGHDTHYNIKKQLLKFKGLTEFFQFAVEIYIACQDLTVRPLDPCAREKTNKIGKGSKSLLKKFGIYHIFFF